MKMNALAIIPARAGSKRILNKNIRPFFNKPIIAYSIETAIKAKCFDEIMVSTESKEIANISLKYGADIPFYRSIQTADAFTPLSNVIMEVLRKYAEQGKNFRFVCCILPTSVFASNTIIRKSFTKLKQKNIDAVISVVKYNHPIQRALTIRNGKLEMILPKHATYRTQDLSASYYDAAQFYWLQVRSFFDQKVFFMKNTLAYELPASRVQDIDTLEDWKIAEIKYKLLNNK